MPNSSRKRRAIARPPIFQRERDPRNAPKLSGSPQSQKERNPELDLRTERRSR